MPTKEQVDRAVKGQGYKKEVEGAVRRLLGMGLPDVSSETSWEKGVKALEAKGKTFPHEEETAALELMRQYPGAFNRETSSTPFLPSPISSEDTANKRAMKAMEKRQPPAQKYVEYDPDTEEKERQLEDQENQDASEYLKSATKEERDIFYRLPRDKKIKVVADWKANR